MEIMNRCFHSATSALVLHIHVSNGWYWKQWRREEENHRINPDGDSGFPPMLIAFVLQSSSDDDVNALSLVFAPYVTWNI